MKWFTPVRKVSIGLAMLTVSLLLVAEMIGVIPNEGEGLLEGRKKFCESLAVQFSLAASRGDVDLISATLATLVNRENDVISAAIRNASGRILARSGDHARNWVNIPLDKSTSTHIQVPILNGSRRWGTIEVAFDELRREDTILGYRSSLIELLGFMTLAGFFVYLFFIKRTLRELDPRSVIPERVKSAFDALAEGLVIIDEKEQIILANSAFADKLETSADKLMGHKLSHLSWQKDEARKDDLPWNVTLANKERHTGVPMKYKSLRNGTRTFMVNTAPITGASGAVRGALATFDDLTDLESKQIQLKQTISNLNKSREELQSKTVELEYLATRDSLTGCLNRRAFFEKAEYLLMQAQQHNSELSCIMVDIDHFKAINDRHGHAMGDKVIQVVTGELRSNARPDDLVGRYGGEEFCIMLPGVSCADAVAIAERLRGNVKNLSHGHFSSSMRITASFGVAEVAGDISSPGEKINLADRALYVAKESGRNRVVAWGDRNYQEHNGISGEDDSRSADAPAPHEHVTEDYSGTQDDQAPAGPGDDLHVLKSRITELEEELAYNHEIQMQRDGRDSVTGLPNRLLFHDRIHQALLRGHRYGRIAAVIVLDIDMFQRINDALGFVIGDQLLKKASERLVDVLRSTDTISLLDENSESPTVSRTGSDEFGILLTDLKDENMVTWIIKRVLDAMSEPLEIDGHEIYITCSAGISLFPHDGDRAETLLQNANAARYVAKKRLGRNKFVFYSADINQVSYKQLWFENQLHHALELDELYLDYQPKVDLQTGRITSMEALIRWKNPKLGFVSPADFIPLAERTGLINEIGDWVIHAACVQARRWQDAGFGDISVAVNLSAVQFRQADLHERILTTLGESGIEPKLLEVEITESILMENYEMAVALLHALNDAGVRLSIDDFGTGYSSLAYLKHMPVSTLKIDRSFLSETVPDRQDELIIKAIIAMAHSMDMTVVAEGVENNAQKTFLTGLQCDEMQGYLFSKPVGKDEALELLRRHNSDTSVPNPGRKSA